MYGRGFGWVGFSQNHLPQRHGVTELLSLVAPAGVLAVGDGGESNTATVSDPTGARARFRLR